MTKRVSEVAGAPCPISLFLYLFCVQVFAIDRIDMAVLICVNVQASELDPDFIPHILGNVIIDGNCDSIAKFRYHECFFIAIVICGWRYFECRMIVLLVKLEGEVD